MINNDDAGIPCSSTDPLTILYEDEYFVAVDKPYDLFVHRTNLDRTQRDSVVQRLKAQLGIKASPIHRLDRPTSGVLLLGRNSEAVRLTNALFADRKVNKRYTALVRGFVSNEGLIDYPLKQKNRQTTQSARTRWRLIEQGELPLPTPPHPTSRFSLVSLYPETGRWHQLRRHFAHLRHPIIGDTSHGDSHQNRMFRAQISPTRLFLHASELSFEHPFQTGSMCTISSPAPASFQALLTLFGWKDAALTSENGSRLRRPGHT